MSSYEEIIEWYGARWKIEWGFKEIKQETGSSKAQVRNSEAVLNHLNLQDSTPVRDFISDTTRYMIKNGRRFRALDPTGKDIEILQAISNRSFQLAGFTNKMLRHHLSGSSFAARGTDKQLSAKTSRCLRLLRAHGIIRKLPRQNRYLLTIKGVRLPSILNAFLAASTEDLLKMAA